MGELICLRCNAKAEGETFAEADELIDHAIGKSKGFPCNGDPTQMRWNGDPVAMRPTILLADMRPPTEEDIDRAAEEAKAQIKHQKSKSESKQTKAKKPKKSKGQK